ncbi:MAG: 5-formyltetrahydrofolate cyclo-ligase [Nitrincola sp.]|nr:5-formyltetrahydrofolate cyclo-ligase [Nitrincola sp.]
MSFDHAQMDRKQLRKKMRALRRSLSPFEQKRHSQQLCKTLRDQLLFRRSKHIALYLANDGEINPEALIQLCWRLKKTVYLPVLHPIGRNSLWFVPYQPNTPMQINRYKIKEPQIINAPRRQPWSLDLVFMPLVAFDQQGGRLGMGGGYYDRTFAFKLKRTKNGKGKLGPKLIGLAHSFQQVDKLSIEDWDVPLTGVATEECLWRFDLNKVGGN